MNGTPNELQIEVLRAFYALSDFVPPDQQIFSRGLNAFQQAMKAKLLYAFIQRNRIHGEGLFVEFKVARQFIDVADELVDMCALERESREIDAIPAYRLTAGGFLWIHKKEVRRKRVIERDKRIAALREEEQQTLRQREAEREVRRAAAVAA